jgi:hypothetical protein
LELSDSIAFAGLIASIVPVIAIPFLERPMLGYDTSPSLKKPGVDNVEIYNITIHNIGFVSLTNIVGSVNIDIINFTSQPFLADLFSNVTNSTGSGFFKIDVLPAQSDANVMTEINTTGYDPSHPVTTHITSDEWRGYPTWYIHLINIVALILAIILTYFLIQKWRQY